MDGFFKRLTQQELSALGRGDVAVGAQRDVVGRQRVRGHEEAEVALDDATLVFGQTVGVFPERDVAVHVHFLRHPVVGTGGEVFFPGPLVLEGHQLVDVGLTVDDALVGHVDATLAGRGGRSGGGGMSCRRREACVVERGHCRLQCRFDLIVPGQHRNFQSLNYESMRIKCKANRGGSCACVTQVLCNCIVFMREGMNTMHPLRFTDRLRSPDRRWRRT